MEPIWTLSAIIIVGGLFGGWASYLIAAGSPQPPDQSAPAPNFTRYLVLGVVASACVPLFLSLVKSDLVTGFFKNAGTNPPTIPIQDYLVFLGFCLIAAVSARNFIDTISKKLIQDVDRANQNAAEAAKGAKEAQERAKKAENQAAVAAELVDEAAEPTEPQAARLAVEDNMPAGTPVPPTDQEELKALKVMMNVSFRTATGISHDTKIPRNRIGEMLDSLASKALVERTISPATGGPRWRITPLGVRALKSEQ